MHLLNWASPTLGASEVGLPHVTRALGLFFLEKRVARAAFDLGQWLQARPQPLHAAPQAQGALSCAELNRLGLGEDFWEAF